MCIFSLYILHRNLAFAPGLRHLFPLVWFVIILKGKRKRKNHKGTRVFVGDISWVGGAVCNSHQPKALLEQCITVYSSNMEPDMTVTPMITKKKLLQCMHTFITVKFTTRDQNYIFKSRKSNRQLPAIVIL